MMMKNKRGKTLEEIGIIENYKASLKKKFIVIFVLVAILIVFFFVSVFVGSSGLSFVDTFFAIFGQGDSNNVLIVWNIRMPRILAAILAGSGLAISGCIMQATLKNPLAAPSTLGVSSAATLGANIALIIIGGGSIAIGNISNNPYLVTFFAFIFSLISIGFIVALSKFRNYKPEVVVLAGLGIGTLFSGITTLIQYFASDTELSSAISWTFGDLGRATYTEDLIIFVVLAVCIVIFSLFSWSYNAMRTGDDTAKSMGIRVNFVRGLSLLFASLITAVCISFFGIIGFIGIIAPHIMKRFVGTDYRFLIPASCLMGSITLVFSDTLSRIIVPGISIPVGAITAILGAPIFIFIIFAKKGVKS